MTLIDHGPQHGAPAVCPTCKKRHPQPWAHRNERICLHCKQAKNKRRDYEDRHAQVCNDCMAVFKAADEARWNSKTEAEHAADGDALFARMADRRR